MPNGRVRMVPGGMIGTRRMDRCADRVPWSPMVVESVVSSRSPMRVVRSWRSRLLDAPPRMILTIDASQIAEAAFSDFAYVSQNADVAQFALFFE